MTEEGQLEMEAVGTVTLGGAGHTSAVRGGCCYSAPAACQEVGM